MWKSSKPRSREQLAQELMAASPVASPTISTWTEIRRTPARNSSGCRRRDTNRDTGDGHAWAPWRGMNRSTSVADRLRGGIVAVPRGATYGRARIGDAPGDQGDDGRRDRKRRRWVADRTAETTRRPTFDVERHLGASDHWRRDRGSGQRARSARAARRREQSPDKDGSRPAIPLLSSTSR